MLLPGRWSSRWSSTLDLGSVATDGRPSAAGLLPPRRRRRLAPAGVSLAGRARRKAALDLVDRDGLDELSMRKLAAELGVEAMSLYKHVANKEDVLGGLTDLI